MLIRTAQDLGELIRTARQAQEMTQTQLAGAADTGLRFIVDLEKGKPTCELHKALRVATMLGIQIEAKMP